MDSRFFFVVAVVVLFFFFVYVEYNQCPFTENGIVIAVTAAAVAVAVSAYLAIELT